MSLEKGYQVTWEIRNARKKTALHRKLFGFKVRVRDKNYYYDGLLKGWKGGRRVILVVFEKIANGHYVFDEETAEQVSNILGKLKIDHRLLPYDGKNNYFRHYK